MPDLPPKDSPDIHLVVATPEELIQQTHANSTEWRGSLSVEAYQRREKHLLDQVLTRDGGLTPWMLVYQPSSGNGSRLVLCGCESIKKKALVARAGGEVEDVIAHGVASVFCPPKHRGKGYASRLMEEVGKRLRTWQDQGTQKTLFSVLYSDIGKDFYAARGWQPFPSAHISLRAEAVPEQPAVKVELLEAEDLPELCAIDERLLRKRLSKMGDQSKTRVAIVPEIATLQWHHAREDFVTTELYHKTAEIKGAMVGSEPGKRVWCYWTRVWANPQEESGNTLHILRLVVEDDTFSDFLPAFEASNADAGNPELKTAIAALFAAAQAEAVRWDMKTVQIWSPTSTTLAAARLLDHDASVIHRESESIASMRWYGEGSWQDVDWVCNEKYGWC